MIIKLWPWSKGKLHQLIKSLFPEEVQQLKALQEEYDSAEKELIHLWDFAGQHVSGGITSVTS